MPAKGKYLNPNHPYTPRSNRPDRFRANTGWLEKLQGSDECVHCVSTKDNPRSTSTYIHRFSPEKHPLSWIIQEEP